MLQKILISLILLGSACLGGLLYVSEQPFVDLSVLEHYNPGKPSILLDDQGNEWGRFQLDKREVKPIRDIPKVVIQAFIAAEDWHFYSHIGLSIKGIVRSLLVNTIRLKKAQGASTITQQLVRLLYFDTAKSYSRKIKEQLLSLIIEQQFTKDQIMEAYLNHIYLGSGIYGVEAACQRFWNKSVTAISLDEAAILASIVRYPARYCPLHNALASATRRNHILRNMAMLGFITPQERDEAIAKPVILAPYDPKILAPHLKESIRLFLEETVGKHKLYTGGLKIQTTLNKKMQQQAERIFKAYIKQFHEEFSPDLDGGLLCIEGATGQIKSLIGGYDFNASQFNRVLQARRQLGSIIKPLLFAQAVMHGQSFADVEIDEPLEQFESWNPRNANRKFEGPMTLAHALATSNNIICIKTLLHNDPHELVSLTKACGLEGAQPYPSLALGCLDGTLYQAVPFMNIFAHHGTLVEPHSLLWVKDEWGTKLWKGATSTKQVLDHTVCHKVAKVLTHRIEQARKKYPKAWFACQGFGKTGTTNDARSCWFVGSTPLYTTGVYIGQDDNRSPGNMFGSLTAFPLWREFNKHIPNGTEEFSFDPSLKEAIIHGRSGESCSEDEPDSIAILI